MQNPAIGIVLIGRNEGERLVRCLDSLIEFAPKLVYVDSDSKDESVKNALERGAQVINLDMSKPFSAARARNEGFRALISRYPEISLVQFVDGDCAVADGWFQAALSFLQSDLSVAVVCGRRCELFPQKSIYNQFCDDEWNTPVGEAKACGGDALMRVEAFQKVGGFRDSLIAGEEPELCIRLRQAGYKIWRIQADMTWHDANMTRFKQWWQRCKRGGYAYAEGAYLHGAAPEFHRVAESKRALLWGFLMPICLFMLAAFKPVIAVSFFLIYPLQWFRLTIKQYRKNNQAGIQQSLLRAFFLVLSKFPEAMGLMKFRINLLTHRQSKIIEYK
jgi:GT2 family glycosyltransferase